MTWLLKYFSAIFTGTLGAEFEYLNQMIPMDKLPHLMAIYGLGFVCIWLDLYLMYRHTLKNREALDLNEIEIYETEYSLKEKRSLLLIGILSVSLAGLSIIFDYPLGAALAGWVYNLIWVIAIFSA